jgi:hypothetical protein
MLGVGQAMAELQAKGRKRLTRWAWPAWRREELVKENSVGERRNVTVLECAARLTKKATPRPLLTEARRGQRGGCTLTSKYSSEWVWQANNEKADQIGPIFISAYNPGDSPALGDALLAAACALTPASPQATCRSDTRTHENMAAISHPGAGRLVRRRPPDNQCMLDGPFYFARVQIGRTWLPT